MKSMILMVAVAVLAVASLAEATNFGAGLNEQGQQRTFGWQERERRSDSTIQLGGDGTAGEAAAESAAASSPGPAGGEGNGDSCGPR